MELLEASQYPSILLSNLYSFYQRQVMCDVIITAKCGSEVKAHWLVVSATCAYFSTQADHEAVQYVMMPDVSLTSLERLMEFLYTGQLMLTEDTAVGVMTTASALQCQEALKLCSQFLQRYPHLCGGQQLQQSLNETPAAPFPPSSSHLAPTKPHLSALVHHLMQPVNEDSSKLDRDIMLRTFRNFFSGRNKYEKPVLPARKQFVVSGCSLQQNSSLLRDMVRKKLVTPLGVNANSVGTLNKATKTKTRPLQGVKRRSGNPDKMRKPVGRPRRKPKIESTEVKTRVCSAPRTLPFYTTVSRDGNEEGEGCVTVVRRQKWACPKCPRSFQYRHLLAAHSLALHASEATRYTNSLARARATLFCGRYVSVSKIAGSVRATCSICGATWLKRSMCRSHLSTRHMCRWPCLYYNCPRAFLAPAARTSHALRASHSARRPALRRCLGSPCGCCRLFLHPATLERHRRAAAETGGKDTEVEIAALGPVSEDRHPWISIVPNIKIERSDNVLKCREAGCSYTASSHEDLAIHVRRAHPSALKTCRDCCLNTKIKQEYQDHSMKLHARQKCPECGAMLRSLATLAAHRARIHGTYAGSGKRGRR